MSSIVISATTGYLNLGDEAMLSENLRVLREAGVSAVTVLSDDPPTTHTLHGVEAIPSFYRAFHLRYGSAWRKRYRVVLPIYLTRLVWNAHRLRRGNGFSGVGPAERLVLRTIAEADVFLMVGGGFFNDLWRFHGIYARGAEILVAKRLGKPVFIGAQGVGPIHRCVSRLALSYILRGTFLTLRDFGVSQREVVGRLRIPGARVLEALDDAFQLSPKERPACLSLLHSEGVELERARREGRIAGVCVRGWWKRRDQGDWLRTAFPEIIGSLVQKGFFVLILPMLLSKNVGSFDDTSSSQTVLELERLVDNPRVQIVRGISSGSDVKGILGLVDVALGNSWHFNLFALTMGTPAVGLYQDDYYRLKFEGLTRLYGDSAPSYDVRKVPSVKIVSHMICLSTGPRAVPVSDPQRPTEALVAARAAVAWLHGTNRCHPA